MGHVDTISFHASRICRRAFVTKELRLPPIERWTRADTPPAGQRKAVAVLTIFFPEGHLSPDLPTTPKKVIWLEAPPITEVRVVQIFFSNDAAADVSASVEKAGQQLVSHHHLPNGEGVFIRSWIGPWEQPDIIMPASHGRVDDLVFPAVYQAGAVRPEHLVTFARPNELWCFEFTGFRVPAGEAHRHFPHAHVLSRHEVWARGIGREQQFFNLPSYTTMLCHRI